MKILHATEAKPGKDANDDIAGHSGNVFWLMDGATELTPPPHGCNAAWHVGQLHRAFEDILHAEPKIALPALASRAIADVARKFFATTGLDASAPQDARPFATLILCRCDAGTLDYLIVCDSTLAVIGPERTAVLTDPRLGDLKALAPLDTLLKGGSGFNSPAFKAAMRNVYDHVFGYINAAGGFDVIGQDAGVVDRAVTGTIALEPGDTVLLMSDGFTRAVDTLALYPSWAALVTALKSEGPQAIIDRIRAAERADGDGRRFPRPGIHDDATVLALWPDL